MIENVVLKCPPTHPPLYCNEEDIERFGLQKEEFQALQKVLKSLTNLSTLCKDEVQILSQST